MSAQPVKTYTGEADLYNKKYAKNDGVTYQQFKLDAKNKDVVTEIKSRLHAYNKEYHGLYKAWKELNPDAAAVFESKKRRRASSSRTRQISDTAVTSSSTTTSSSSSAHKTEDELMSYFMDHRFYEIGDNDSEMLKDIKLMHQEHINIKGGIYAKLQQVNDELHELGMIAKRLKQKFKVEHDASLVLLETLQDISSRMSHAHIIPNNDEKD